MYIYIYILSAVHVHVGEPRLISFLETEKLLSFFVVPYSIRYA